MLSLMPCRLTELQATVQGLHATGIPLIDLQGRHFGPAGFSDDAGIYFFVPELAKLLHLGLHQAIILFFCGLIVVSFILGSIGTFLTFKGALQRLVSLLFLSAVTGAAFFLGDVYVMAFAASVAVIPLFLYFLPREQSRRTFGIFLFLSGVFLGLMQIIRSQSATATLLIVAVLLLTFGFKRQFQKATFLGILVIGLLTPLLAFHGIVAHRDDFLTQRVPGYTAVSPVHPFWHSIYIGLGFLSNKQIPSYHDEVGIRAAQAVDPKVVECSYEYEAILRRLTFKFILHDKKSIFFFIMQLFAKMGVCLGYFLVFANVGIYYSWKYPKRRGLDVAFLLGLMMSALPGLLVVPYPNYLLGLITLSALYAIYSINHGLDARRAARQVDPSSELAPAA